MHAYDMQNYSHHLAYKLYTQKNLRHTQISLKEFTTGKFSVQRKLGSFNNVPSDQVIEQVINKDKNGSGGSTESTVQ